MLKREHDVGFCCISDSEYERLVEESVDGEEEGEAVYLAMCVRNLKTYLQQEKGMSKEASKDFIAKRIRIEVNEAVYDGNLDLRSASVVAIVQASTADDSSKGITLQYRYYHRCRWSSFDHSACLTYCLHGTPGVRSKEAFRSTNEDVPAKNACQVERRNFFLSSRAVAAIRDDVFGEGWSTLEALVVCYAAVGVHYRDGRVQLVSDLSFGDTASFKDGWLEHHTRKVCGAETEEDEGYETEPFEQRYQEELMLENELDSDEFSDEEYSGDEHEGSGDVGGARLPRRLLQCLR